MYIRHDIQQSIVYYIQLYLISLHIIIPQGVPTDVKLDY